MTSTEQTTSVDKTTTWKAPTWATETVRTEAGLMYRRPATCVPVEKLEGDAMPVTVELNVLDYLDAEDGMVTLTRGEVLVLVGELAFSLPEAHKLGNALAEVLGDVTPIGGAL